MTLHIGEFTQGMMRADGPDPDGFPRPSGGVPRIRRVIRVQADGTCVGNGRSAPERRICRRMGKLAALSGLGWYM